MAINYQQGHIVNVDLGQPPREVMGHEQGLTRPCIIIKALPALKLVIVVPCTSQQPVYSHYTIVKRQKSAGGLTLDSFVLCHQIRTVSIDRILKTVGSVDAKDLLKIKAVLLDTLDL